MSHLLLVEDDAGVAKLLALAMRSLGHTVTVAPDGYAGLDALDRETVDVVLLDVMMPGIDGFETARRMRVRSQVPIVMLTARSDPVDIVAGLECGADDYVTKPAEPRVLDARVKAILRRATPAPEDVVVHRIGDLVLDPGARKLSRGASEVPLTPTEFDVAHELRTPTAALLASAESLAHPETRDVASGLVIPQLRRLAGLTEDLLEISRLDAGRAAVVPSQVDLVDLVREVVDETGRPVDVALSAPAELPVELDPARTRVVVRNLVATACSTAPRRSPCGWARPWGRRSCPSPTPARGCRPTCASACSTGSPAATRPGTAPRPAWGWPSPARTPACSAARSTWAPTGPPSP